MTKQKTASINSLARLEHAMELARKYVETQSEEYKNTYEIATFLTFAVFRNILNINNKKIIKTELLPNEWGVVHGFGKKIGDYIENYFMDGCNFLLNTYKQTQTTQPQGSYVKHWPNGEFEFPDFSINNYIMDSKAQCLTTKNVTYLGNNAPFFSEKNINNTEYRNKALILLVFYTPNAENVNGNMEYMSVTIDKIAVLPAWMICGINKNGTAYKDKNGDARIKLHITENDTLESAMQRFENAYGVKLNKVKNVT